MRKGWVVKALSEIADVQYGYTDKAYEEGDFRYVRITDIDSNGELVTSDKKYIKYSKEASEFILLQNDLLMARTGATFGKILIFNNNEPSVFASYLIKIKFKNKFVNKLFWYFSKSSDYWKQANMLSSGAAQPQFNGNAVKQLLFPLPPLSEQQEIVSILDDAFESIERAKSNAEQNLRNAKELFESYLQNVFENKSEDWEETLLGDVLVKTETIDPSKNPNVEFVYLDVSSVNKESKEIETTSKLLGKDAPSRARKLIRTNDVIFATVRPTHSRVAMITEEYDKQVCSTGYFVLRAKEVLSNKLIFYFLLTNRFNKQMEKLQKGASYPAVTDTEVKGIKISFPKSLKEQNKIVKKLEVLSVEIKNLESIYKQKLNDIEELKKSILQKAFNGDLIHSK